MSVDEYRTETLTHEYEVNATPKEIYVTRRIFYLKKHELARSAREIP